MGGLTRPSHHNKWSLVAVALPTVAVLATAARLTADAVLPTAAALVAVAQANAVATLVTAALLTAAAMATAA